MRNWLVAGGLAAIAGVAQGADVEIFGIHTPAVGKWAVYARLTNVGGASGISSISVDVLNNTGAAGTSTVTSSAVTLPSGVSRYTDPQRWPEATEGVGYGFWVPNLRRNGDIDSAGATGISATQFTTYNWGTSTVPYKDLLLPGIGVTAGSALKNDTTGGNYKTSAGYWGYPVQIASGSYTPAGLSGAGAALGVKMGYSDAFGSVNVLRWNPTAQDYTVETAGQHRVVDARNFTLGGNTLSDSTVYARGGDADLNGSVNFDDLLSLAKYYQKPGATWFQGDFDYNGTVDFDDLLILAKNYGAAAPTGPVLSTSFDADVAAAFTAVPEPGAALGLIGIAFMALGGRRQRL